MNKRGQPFHLIVSQPPELIAARWAAPAEIFVIGAFYKQPAPLFLVKMNRMHVVGCGMQSQEPVRTPASRRAGPDVLLTGEASSVDRGRYAQGCALT